MNCQQQVGIGSKSFSFVLVICSSHAPASVRMANTITLMNLGSVGFHFLSLAVSCVGEDYLLPSLSHMPHVPHPSLSLPHLILLLYGSSCICFSEQDWTRLHTFTNKYLPLTLIAHTFRYKTTLTANVTHR